MSFACLVFLTAMWDSGNAKDIAMNKFHRREFILAGLGLAVTGLPARAGETDARLKALEARLGGRAGLMVLDTGSGQQLTWRADERFAMCSSFKWLLATAVLAKTEQGALTLKQVISYSEKDLAGLGVAPITRAHVKEGALSVETLCAAAVEESDNGAANLLLKQVGGPKGLTRYLRRIGDDTTRLDRNEPTLNENRPGDPRDTTTPSAMVKTMRKVLMGDALKPQSRDLLLDWLRNCKTGAKRLRAGLPADWQEGDKTGTGSRGATVDDAIIWPPKRAPILAAAYLSDSSKSVEEREAAMAEMGRLIAETFAG
jgi:beta-lactamase class A